MDLITWIFFDEGKEDSPDFEIEARNYTDAYYKAYELYGPQVKDMYYKKKPIYTEKPMITFYQILDESYEVLGTYLDFSTAQSQMRDGYILRYFDGQNYIYNVNKSYDK